ncbi:LysR family transcriptional regulator [uncultured Sphingopyxis sp.]|uniref:LysR family transcriptional regulator n=1 Tax=uncultured Sphingopyxis sp. TaxID=310581 RepID=A0A1Y5PP91_9SPHN|nr:LysR substrate-binding domain-containing protein [uncultured Sphingopyxis sp.]SBV31829.1 LysR family transcriptional regulator [uncultured Sphingopyxis sp.]
MQFRQLEIFRALMISGSASRAAELLNITQPAVSRAIAELEFRVGFSLFDRVKGRLVPTPEGQMFFEDVSTAFTGLDSLRAAAARIRDFGSGSLKIASLAALGSTLVPRAIRKFREANPNIAITLQILSSSNVRDHVANKRFDIGLAADEVDLSGVDHSVFTSVRAVCAMPADHPLRHLDVVGPEDLHNMAFIALAPDDRARARLSETFDAVNSRPQIVIETPASATVCALALEGVGLGLVNPLSADGYQQRGLILKPYQPAVYFKTFILYRPDAQRARLVREFVAALNAARRNSPSA